MNRTTYIIYPYWEISIEIIDNSIEIIDKLYRYVISDTLRNHEFMRNSRSNHGFGCDVIP